MGTIIKHDDGSMDYTFQYWLDNVESRQHKSSLKIVEEVIHLSLPSLNDSYLGTVQKIKPLIRHKISYHPPQETYKQTRKNENIHVSIHRKR